MPGRIPKPFIDELLVRADIVDVIDARVPLTKAGKDYKARCPFHDEKTPSFTVSADKQFYHCFGCGAHGSAIGFLMTYDHMSFREAVEELAARAGLPMPEGVAASDEPRDAGDELLEILAEAERYYRRQLRQHPQAQRAVSYLKGRGLSGEIAGRFELGFAPEGWDNLLVALGRDEARRDELLRAGLIVKKTNGGYYDRFRNRVMFPIRDRRGRVVGFGGRVLDDAEPKYLNSPETPLFHKGREMYGLYLARDAIRREHRALVVEGYTDVLALAQFGIDFAVATLGTATTRDHLHALFRLTPDVTFCFDGDRAGREAAWRALEAALPTMQDGRQVSFLFLPEAEDPDSVVRKEGREGMMARIGQATPLPELFFETLQKRTDVSRLDGRARLAELARPLLSKIPRGVLQQMMVDRLAAISGLSADKLSPLLGTTPTSRSSREPAAHAGAQLRRPPSLVRTAAALLLHHPTLVQRVPETDELSALEMPGIPVLQALLELLKAQPDLRTGAIIERFRGDEHGPLLEKLAVWTHPVLEHGVDVEAEFIGVIEQLRQALHAQRTDALLRKERAEGLGSAERAELTRLLAGKSGSPAG
ncbi:MAG: DNA primase [Acidiferrobacterales bacterium]